MLKKISNQHGDVVIEVVKEVPSGAKEIKVADGYILERGEGVHTHIFPDVKGIRVFEKDGEIYVKVEDQTIIDHEEHGRQTIKSPCIKKRIERVWDYETEEARKVID